MQVAIIGGTGKLGAGLAKHFVASGHTVLIGSRDAGRAREAAKQVGDGANGLTNSEAALHCETAVIALPYSSVRNTVAPLADALKDKVVISTVVPLRFSDGAALPLVVAAGSAAQEIAELLPGSQVSAALHSVSSRQLKGEKPLNADTLICSDHQNAVDVTSKLVQSIPGLRAIVAGGLELAVACEQLTAVLLSVNRRYDVISGLQLTGV
jgi:8-hydroxy-5-deazaflavin:NADPH oxidoreductase